jgi:hypothetical protein
MDARTIAALWLLLGLVGGATYFALLRRNASLYLRSGVLLQAIGLQVLRLAMIASLLGLVAWQGALPLLLVALGIVLVRPLVLRHFWITA